VEFIQEAVRRLTEEARRIERELRVELPREIGKAAAMGDLSENAEYQAAKERQITLEARLGQIRRRLSELARIDLAAIPRDRSGLGSEVTVEDVESGERIRYTLVVPEAADGRRNMVSVAAPVGRALLGRRPGDAVTVQVPKGTLEFEVRRVVTCFGEELA